LALAMVLHELATNAVKFGALSNDSGTIAVGWKTGEAETGRRLFIDWEESGGPEVAAPKRRGFGTRMLERAVGRELKGQAVMAFEPAGMRGRIDVPLESVMAA
jgi:two-component sensor histidine kinase